MTHRLARQASRCWLVGARRENVSNLGSPMIGPATGTEVPQISTRIRSASRHSGYFTAALATSLFRRLVARPHLPNPSVKGTSCGKPQAAPYLER